MLGCYPTISIPYRNPLLQKSISLFCRLYPILYLRLHGIFDSVCWSALSTGTSVFAFEFCCAPYISIISVSYELLILKRMPVVCSMIVLTKIDVNMNSSNSIIC